MKINNALIMQRLYKRLNLTEESGDQEEEFGIGRRCVITFNGDELIKDSKFTVVTQAYTVGWGIITTVPANRRWHILGISITAAGETFQTFGFDDADGNFTGNDGFPIYQAAAAANTLLYDLPKETTLEAGWSIKVYCAAHTSGTAKAAILYREETIK